VVRDGKFERISDGLYSLAGPICQRIYIEAGIAQSYKEKQARRLCFGAPVITACRAAALAFLCSNKGEGQDVLSTTCGILATVLSVKPTRPPLLTVPPKWIFYFTRYDFFRDPEVAFVERSV